LNFIFLRQVYLKEDFNKKEGNMSQLKSKRIPKTKAVVGKSKFGRGIFAIMNLRKNELVEVCETLLLKNEESLGTLKSYVYEYDEEHVLLSLGNGSLFNHSFTPNIEVQVTEDRKLEFRALKAIKAGEELCFDYAYTKEEFERDGISN
jgi:SET domain-containing protein